jgi:hypothetical protein
MDIEWKYSVDKYVFYLFDEIVNKARGKLIFNIFVYYNFSLVYILPYNLFQLKMNLEILFQVRELKVMVQYKYENVLFDRYHMFWYNWTISTKLKNRHRLKSLKIRLRDFFFKEFSYQYIE